MKEAEIKIIYNKIKDKKANIIKLLKQFESPCNICKNSMGDIGDCICMYISIENECKNNNYNKFELEDWE